MVNQKLWHIYWNTALVNKMNKLIWTNFDTKKKHPNFISRMFSICRRSIHAKLLALLWLLLFIFIDFILPYESTTFASFHSVFSALFMGWYSLIRIAWKSNCNKTFTFSLSIELTSHLNLREPTCKSTRQKVESCDYITAPLLTAPPP